MKRRKRTRTTRRDRPIFSIVGVLFIVVVEGFSPTDVPFTQQHRLPSKRALAVDILEAAVQQENNEDSVVAIVPSPVAGIALGDEDEAKLPPWLSRYEHATPGEVLEEMDWLEIKLLRREWERPAIQEIQKAIYAAADGDCDVAVGCIDFLKTFLQIDDEAGIFVTQTILLAAVQHYIDCILVRRQGVQGVVRQIMLKDEPNRLLGSTQQPSAEPSSMSGTNPNGSALTTVSTRRPTPPKEVEAIEDSASRIKRAEILASVFLASSDWSDPASANHIRSLFLSVTGDVRGLAIRLVACLYRLEGVLQQHTPGLIGEYAPRTPDSIRAAKEGIQIYAPFAERLGMHNLKAKIEDAAFRVLYRRQYKAVLSLYLESGHVMNSVSNYLYSETTRMLREDEILMSQLDDIQINVRVKQPFSLWKKLLKKGTTNRDELVSFQQVFDVVALRVVLRARKWTADEDEDTTRSREHLLCYYVQNILRTRWGTIRLKDYIQSPKPNGYQSLHHTSSITSGGIELPFEVQVRSEEMHHRAEHGIASHWHYKLDNAIAAPTTTTRPPPQSFLLCSSSNDTVSSPSGGQDLPQKTNNQEDEKGSELAEESNAPRSFYRGSTGSYLDALLVAKDTMPHVYVFMADQDDQRSQLVSLPVNSNVQDVLMSLESQESELSSQSILWKNGREARFDDIVENGDVLWIGTREQ